MASDETRYTNKIFMAAALPLMKTIATDVPCLLYTSDAADD